MFQVCGVSHGYGRRPALSGISLRFSPGVTGLVGENGAGKTTLLHICSGILTPRSGEVTLDGRSLTGAERRSVLSQVALMPQTAPLPSRFTTLEFVSYLTWMRGVSTSEARRRAEEALAKVDLAGRRDDKLGALSGGMQRRVWLAQALAARPRVLLLDEPSTGLDPRQRDTMLRILHHLDDETIVVLSSHIVEDVATLADNLVALQDGRVAYAGPVPENFDADAFLAMTAGKK